MEVSLREFEEFIQENFKSGRYSSIDEMVQKGLRLLRVSKEGAVNTSFDNEIKNGLNSGPSTVWDKESFLIKSHIKADNLGLPK